MRTGAKKAVNLSVEGHDVVLATADIAAILQTELGERVASVADRRSDIIRATDFPLTGD